MRVMCRVVGAHADRDSGDCEDLPEVKISEMRRFMALGDVNRTPRGTEEAIMRLQ